MIHCLEEITGSIGPIGSAVWGLVGVVAGAFLSRLSWHKDNRRREYGELIDGLKERVSEILDARPERNKRSANLAKLNDAVNTGFSLVRTRVFIRERSLEEIKKSWHRIQLCAQWDEEDVHTNQSKPLVPYNQSTLEDLWRELETQLVTMCRRDMKVWPFY